MSNWAEGALDVEAHGMVV
jgi:hypothetical protein